MKKTIKIGRICISAGEKFDASSYAETLAAIRFFPVHVEYIHHLQCFQMIGMSEMFEPIQEGVKAPFYELQITTLDDGAQTVTVVRKEDNDEENI